jgi:hypothetical protein
MKYSISLHIKEMQIKMILRSQLTPVRTSIIKKTNNFKCWIWGGVCMGGEESKKPLFTAGGNVN